MSYQAVRWAMYDAPMLATPAGKPDTSARQVLSVLAEHADEHGANAYPGPTRIAYATGLDERTIQRAERRLEAAGLIARDGVSRDGTTRWKLAMSTARPESDWAVLLEAAVADRRSASRSRQSRRGRMSGTQNAGQSQQSSMHREPMSGTQNAGQIDDGENVRHAESRRPARRMPDVRHATPPEPPREPPGTTTGGTLPPDPLRPQAPTTSGLGSDSEQDQIGGPQQPGDLDRNHRPRARTDPPALRLIQGEASNDEADPDGHGFCVPCYRMGKTTLAADPVNGSRCALHLRTA